MNELKNNARPGHQIPGTPRLVVTLVGRWQRVPRFSNAHNKCGRENHRITAYKRNKLIINRFIVYNNFIFLIQN